MGIFDGFKGMSGGKGIFGGFKQRGGGNRIFGPTQAAPPPPPVSAPEPITQGERLAQNTRGLGNALKNFMRAMKDQPGLPMRTCPEGHLVPPGSTTCSHGHYVG